jgi:hypothetical protein
VVLYRTSLGRFLRTNRLGFWQSGRTGPEALGSPAGYVVPPGQCLLWPHRKLSVPPSDLWIRRWVFALRPRMGWNREAPQFTLHDYFPVPPSIPRRTRRLLLAVASPSMVAFAVIGAARHPHYCFRGCKVRFMLRPGELLALLTRTFTFELSPPGSPRRGVEYGMVKTRPQDCLPVLFRPRKNPEIAPFQASGGTKTAPKTESFHHPTSNITTWVNSQFPRPDLHRLVTQHYGLRPIIGNYVRLGQARRAGFWSSFAADDTPQKSAGLGAFCLESYAPSTTRGSNGWPNLIHLPPIA